MTARYKLPGAPEAKVYLQEWRETKFDTQQALSNATGLPTPTISRYETGQREWGKGYLEALAYVVGCRVQDLFNPPPKALDSALRSTLLCYGVDESNLNQVIAIINTFSNRS
ncbi:MAG: Toxin from toxin-antitoxin system [Candidatus Tokpelaia sp. JSC189]|nr:MAG: Toxin from toxin-antitoxin system [Candidatus Tokpelaia sp. JSC189]